MMRHKSHSIAAVMMACAALALPHAARGANDAPLNKAVDSATLIVVGRMDQYIAERESLDRYVKERIESTPGMLVGGNPEQVAFRTVQVRGTYVFHIERTLKGKSPEPLIVRLPRASGITGEEPGFFVAPHAHLPLKGYCLLLLKGDPASGYVPTISGPIPVSKKAAGSVAPVDGQKPDAIFSSVVQVLVDSLDDPKVRPAAVHLLSEGRGENILKALRAHAEDKDDTLRADALEGMALNQDRSAIPRIVGWKYSNPNITGNPVIRALEKYNAKDAIPALNRLLIDPRDQYTRLNAAMALHRLPPDRSSIPYLVKALRDPDNHDTAIYAWWCLSRIAPEIATTRAQIGKPLPEQDIKRIEKWWEQEQAKLGPT